MPGTARTRRLDEYDKESAAYHTRMRQDDPGYQVPEGFQWNDRTQQVVQSHPYKDALRAVSPYLLAAPAAGGLAAGALGGTPAVTTGVPSGLPGAVSGFGAGAGKSMINPQIMQMLIGGGMSLAGGLFGGNDQQERVPYKGAASAQNTLEQLLKGIAGFGSGLEKRQPVRLRTTVPNAPGPVQIPGLPFQIGGGLGHDPAIDDPRSAGLGSGSPMGTTFQDMLKGLGGPGESSARGPAPSARQRKPEAV